MLKYFNQRIFLRLTAMIIAVFIIFCTLEVAKVCEIANMFDDLNMILTLVLNKVKYILHLLTMASAGHHTKRRPTSIQSALLWGQRYFSQSRFILWKNVYGWILQAFNVMIYYLCNLLSNPDWWTKRKEEIAGTLIHPLYRRSSTWCLQFIWIGG